MATARRLAMSGDARLVQGGGSRLVQASTPPALAVARRLTMSGGLRLTQSGGWRLIQSSSVLPPPEMGSGSPDPDYTLFSSEGPDPSRTAWD